MDVYHKDEAQNAVVGSKVKLVNCSNCMVHTSNIKEVVLEGLDGYIVSERDGRLLVCKECDEQQIKEFRE